MIGGREKRLSCRSWSIAIRALGNARRVSRSSDTRFGYMSDSHSAIAMSKICSRSAVWTSHTKQVR